MLCVRVSVARKSSTWARSTAAFGPRDTTWLKPTWFCRAQSSMAEVSAPDCETSASEPSAASGPAALAFRFRCGRWKPRQLGPSRCTPSRRAMRLSWAACSGSTPSLTISAERQAMRPATSSAATISSAGSAMTARSARERASSPRVPVVSPCRNCGGLAPGAACSAARSTWAWRVWRAGSSGGPAKTTTERGVNSGARKWVSMSETLIGAQAVVGRATPRQKRPKWPADTGCFGVDIVCTR
mmetsp:Transcript_59265/g.139881  ORF Transcript_59265/g.139881 Transcript_59265/m.139881 type:complete len:242 (+) Transcript_59265:581-1306(+)